MVFGVAVAVADFFYVGVAVVLLIFFPWMLNLIVGITETLFKDLPMYLR